MYHYVYRITNIAEKKHYYGKRSCKILPKMDLGIKYFSSSTDLVFMSDQQTNKNNYKYKIVKIFKTAKMAITYEVKLHNKFNVGINPAFYNKCKQTSELFDTTGIPLSEEHKRKINPTGRKLTQITKDKIRQKSYKETLTPETRYAMGKANRGKRLLDSTKEKLRLANLGRKHTKKFCEKRSQYTKGKNNPRAKPVDIFEYDTDICIAKNVILTIWCENTEYRASMLMQTLKGDFSKPHYFSHYDKSRYNPTYYKGLYVRLTDDK